MIGYLFLPKKFAPPYQTIIYFPGTDPVSLLDQRLRYEVDRVYHQERQGCFVSGLQGNFRGVTTQI